MKRVNAGVVVLLASLCIMLIASIWFAYQGLVVGEGTVPSDFYIAMTLGIVFSLVVGIGLMFLVFYSSRKGYDEPPSFDE